MVMEISRRIVEAYRRARNFVYRRIVTITFSNVALSLFIAYVFGGDGYHSFRDADKYFLYNKGVVTEVNVFIIISQLFKQQS